MKVLYRSAIERKMMSIPRYPHCETIEALTEKLETSKEGLSDTAAQKNFILYGPNEIEEKKRALFLFFLLSLKVLWFMC